MIVVEMSNIDLDLADPKIIEKVTKRAIKRTTIGAQHQGSKQVRKELAAKASDVKGSIKKTVTDTEGRVSFYTWFLPIDAFTHWQTRRGVSVKIKGGAKTIKSAFKFRGRRSGKALVGMRYKRPDGSQGVRRLFTTGVSAVAHNDGFMEELSESAEDRFQREVDHNINFFGSMV